MTRLQRAVREIAAEVGGRRGQLVWLLVVAVSVTYGYGLIRPAAESLFLEAYTEEGLPLGWLTSAAVLMVLVPLYARLVSRWGLRTMLAIAAALSGVVLVTLLLLIGRGVPGMPFALYVFKEVYIIILIEIFWTIANLNFRIDTARWIYGIFCAAGALGGTAGAFSLTPLTPLMGTENTLWLLVPLLAILLIATAWFPKSLRIESDRSAPKFTGFDVLKKSRYLLLVLLLVGITQIVITLIDYQYQGTMLALFPDKDARTPVMGQVSVGIELCSFALQLLTAAVLRTIGIGWTLLAVPLLLGAATTAYVLLPQFATLAVMKIASKSMDYSLFRASKEILYIPLDYREKTEGKALIDMFTYRFAKGTTGSLLQAVTLIGKLPIAALIAGGIVIWLLITRVLVRRWRASRLEA